MTDSHSKNVIAFNATKASLTRKVRRHLRALGFRKSEQGALEIGDGDKEVIRALHSPQRNERLSANADFLATRAPMLLRHFACGGDVDPDRIHPTLERVFARTWQADLFRLATLTWSVPVSNGFGRRLRYLVWDTRIHKLIGVIAIGDPVFNLKARDDLIGWNSGDRAARLVNVMDAYVLGAVPPYNALLAGKMVACLVRTREIYREFSRTYGGTTGIISGQNKKARLLAVTTSSSMGRSSVYNRLKLDGVRYFSPVGYTRGWGHFHIPDALFDELREYLRRIDHPYADHHRFGQGPNWRLRTTRAALNALGFRNELLRHGIGREVFLCALAANAPKLLRTGKGRPDLSTLRTVRQVSNLALERWVLPRSRRSADYRAWTADDLGQLLKTPRRVLGSASANRSA